jgi:hypothetical protein
MRRKAGRGDPARGAVPTRRGAAVGSGLDMGRRAADRSSRLGECLGQPTW